MNIPTGERCKAKMRLPADDGEHVTTVQCEHDTRPHQIHMAGTNGKGRYGSFCITWAFRDGVENDGILRCLPKEPECDPWASREVVGYQIKGGSE